MSIFFSPKYMANDDFSEPPRRADSKNPNFLFFPDFWVRVTSEARESVSVGFWGSCQLSPFFWGGGSGRRALSIPPPSETQTWPPCDNFFCTRLYRKKELHGVTFVFTRVYRKKKLHVQQELCSHPAHLWATADFVPRLETSGTPKAARVI